MWDALTDVGSAFLSSGPYLIGLVVGAVALAGWYAVIRFAPRITPPNPRIIQAVLLALILGGVLFPRAVGKALDWILENTVERFMGGRKSEELGLSVVWGQGVLLRSRFSCLRAGDFGAVLHYQLVGFFAGAIGQGPVSSRTPWLKPARWVGIVPRRLKAPLP
jgi:hypothetical protein